MRSQLVGALALAALALSACSDDTRPAVDKGVTADLRREAGGPALEARVTEAGARDQGPTSDLPAWDWTGACNAVITSCSTSSTWLGYLNPFTTDGCLSTVKCSYNFLAATAGCQAKIGDLLTCMKTVTAATCDTGCQTQLKALTSTCPCPKGCGPACP